MAKIVLRHISKKIDFEIEVENIKEGEAEVYNVSATELLKLYGELNIFLSDIMLKSVPDIIGKSIIKEQVVTKSNVSAVDTKPKEVVSKAGKYTQSQIIKMKELKEKLGVTNNAELDPFVYTWSAGHTKSYKDLTSENIDKFIDYMHKNQE